jgi:hypothetical protein
LTWSTIKTPPLASEIRFRFGLFIDGREEEEGSTAFDGLRGARSVERKNLANFIAAAPFQVDLNAKFRTLLLVRSRKSRF